MFLRLQVSPNVSSWAYPNAERHLPWQGLRRGRLVPQRVRGAGFCRGFPSNVIRHLCSDVKLQPLHALGFDAAQQGCDTIHHGSSIELVQLHLNTLRAYAKNTPIFGEGLDFLRKSLKMNPSN